MFNNEQHSILITNSITKNAGTNKININMGLLHTIKKETRCSSLLCPYMTNTEGKNENRQDRQ